MSTKTAQPGDQFHGTLAVAVSIGEYGCHSREQLSPGPGRVSKGGWALHRRCGIISGTDERAFTGAEWQK